MSEQQDNLRMVMTFKGDTAGVVNECVKRGFANFTEVRPIQTMSGGEPDKVIITVNFSDEYGLIAHTWLTSAPNPLIVSYQIKRHGY